MGWNLLSSAPTLKSIEEAINDYWCSETYRVNPETLEISHPTKKIEGFRVVKIKGRYRFEFQA